MLRKLGMFIVVIVAVLVAAHFFFRPPSLDGRSSSQAVTASAASTMGRHVLDAARDQDGRSGVVPLLDGPDAFVARVALIRAAEVALDVRYYIWHRDATGLILLDELRKAAERGVRVRLLLDDNGISGMDADLAVLDTMPNVEVRLFNPFVLRTLKPIGYAFDFLRLNRRMHNKSLTADGAVGILGGRNIGDVYFGFGDGVQFLDTDVMVAGPIARDLGTDFDRYWDSGSSHPLDRIVGTPPAGALDTLVADARRAAGGTEGRAYFERLRQSDIVQHLLSGTLEVEWTGVVLVSDDPAKGLGKAATRDLLFPQLMALIESPTRSIDLVSAYFIPGKEFAAVLERHARAGVRTRVLTNSVNATDVVVVHSAYARYRPELLDAGVELFELRPEHATQDAGESRGVAGSSRASLHSKVLAVDGERIFIGSFNFDPRSFLLNTEMGVLIDSPHMAGALADAFSNRFAVASYRPELTANGQLVWDERRADGTTIRHDTEPGTGAMSRFILGILSHLPIEWLL